MITSENMIITSVQHQNDFNGEDTNTVKATIDGVEMQIPKDPANRHYAEIQRLVDAGELTIEDAD